MRARRGPEGGSPCARTVRCARPACNARSWCASPARRQRGGKLRVQVLEVGAPRQRLGGARQEPEPEAHEVALALYAERPRRSATAGEQPEEREVGGRAERRRLQQ